MRDDNRLIDGLGWVRTNDLVVNSQTLCRLSYETLLIKTDRFLKSF